MPWSDFPIEEDAMRIPSRFPIFGKPSGAGDHLPIWLLALCGGFTAFSTFVSVTSITLQLKNYRKPTLQRYVVRIMLMVPLYAISSLIALFSLEAAFFIDAIRDLYEAFVIYTFFQLLMTYLGGERSVLIALHGRPPVPHPAPIGWFLRPMDVSDPWTLLNLKRGVLQYVQVKPILVVCTIVLKATGTYKEGKFAADSGYTYISIVYNASICLSLYCLAMFWVCVHDDLTPFRPVPKFLCVKGILFFSFWQSIGISLLVAARLIKRVGVYTDPEHMSLALVDSLICFEMPFFAVAHQYAFQASDYIDNSISFQARLPFLYALRDAFGLKDVWQDTKDTFRGRGISYQAYEPAEGGLHYGAGRQKRIRAGLRYSKGGKSKYWIPRPGDEALTRGDRGPIATIKRRVDERLAAREGFAPLLPKQAARVVHEDPNETRNGHHVEWRGLSTGLFADSDSDASDAPSLEFDSVEEDDNAMYERARRIGYAGFPNVDVSKEEARWRQWEEEERILAGRSSRKAGPSRSNGDAGGSSSSGSKGKGKASQPKRPVYGAWADMVSHLAGSTASSRAPSHNPTGEGEWLIEGNDDRRANGDPSSAASKKVKSKQPKISSLRPSLPKRRSSRKSPFALGHEDSSEDDDPPAPRLPSDARDIVVEDAEAVDKARARERRSGEPQSHIPSRVYVHHNNPSTQRKGEAFKPGALKARSKDSKDLEPEAPKAPSRKSSAGNPPPEASYSEPHRAEEMDQEQVANTDEVERVYSPDLPGERRISEAVSQEEMPGGDPVQQIERIEDIITRPTPPTSRTNTSSNTGVNHSSHFPPLDDHENPWA